eukprot:1608439-Pleurochrysis_carterae.AAC.3
MWKYVSEDTSFSQSPSPRESCTQHLPDEFLGLHIQRATDRILFNARFGNKSSLQKVAAICGRSPYL